MHTHQQTLLARLGFADPDKADPLHDIACQYLCQPEIAARLLVGVLRKDGEEWKERRMDSRGPEVEVVCQVSKSTGSARQEVVISKGEGQYKSHIGFLDVVLLASQTVTETWPDTCISKGHAFRDTAKGSVAIEVKIARVPASEIIRQINLYREYVKAHRWLAVTAFPLSTEAVASLKNERIEHLKLGENFDKYVAQRRAAGTVEHNSPEI
jgi:hypothetical protein